jgi:nicotinate-nucleotide adenylyltransferase
VTCAPRHRIPPHWPGEKIGLFGGTFDPPHEAHRAASLLAMKRLGLDSVWWLVTPGNPLKDTGALTPLEKRVAAARALVRHPRIQVTGLEADIGARYTFDTIRRLMARCPRAHLVWIMGADNLRQFHRWRKWRALAALVPIAVIDRRETGLRALAGVASHSLSRNRIPENAARSLPRRRPPALVFLHGLKSPLSSTALREHRRSQKCRQSATLLNATSHEPSMTVRHEIEPRAVETVNRFTIS